MVALFFSAYLCSIEAQNLCVHGHQITWSDHVVCVCVQNVHRLKIFKHAQNCPIFKKNVRLIKTGRHMQWKLFYSKFPNGCVHLHFSKWQSAKTTFLFQTEIFSHRTKWNKYLLCDIFNLICPSLNYLCPHTVDVAMNCLNAEISRWNVLKNTQKIWLYCLHGHKYQQKQTERKIKLFFVGY